MQMMKYRIFATREERVSLVWFGSVCVFVCTQWYIMSLVARIVICWGFFFFGCLLFLISSLHKINIPSDTEWKIRTFLFFSLPTSVALIRSGKRYLFKWHNNNLFELKKNTHINVLFKMPCQAKLWKRNEVK